ncbi:response regulator transcription factor [Thiohalorhabdus sp. Cl-TMA]|uniref:Response regulator transcription factor n=1 Tax=Thiohalorhabdus methylotrophus TaxID=3242694 RepID=A0ABV4TSS8_9GAMM
MSTGESTVFIVDDDSAALDATTALVRSVGLQAMAYSSASQFLKEYDPEWSGCLVLDVRMPEMSGLHVQDKLRERELDVPVIVLTAHGDVPVTVHAMKAGAFDFLEKPCSEEVLLDTIQRAIEQDREVRKRTQESCRLAARMENLTQREREILDQIRAGKANKVIAIELGLSERTIEAHRSRIMEKLEARSLSDLIQMILQVNPDPNSNRY